jgi:hypothetical protein
MDARAVDYDAALGNGSFIAFSEQLVVEARAYANIFVALRSCAQPLPLPMSLQAITLISSSLARRQHVTVSRCQSGSLSVRWMGSVISLRCVSPAQ